MGLAKQDKQPMQILENDFCCGCMACLCACPRGAIVFQPDDLGFLYPVVKPDACITCGRCMDVCPNGCFGGSSNDGMTDFKHPFTTYAAQAKDEEILLHCASGGAATIFSNYVVEVENGVVYGCGYDGIRSAHCRATTTKELEEFRGSKYTQSYLGHSFLCIKEDLQNERRVLFIGTPCQVAGLLNYLGDTNLSKLTTIDLVCHGVAGEKQLVDYVKWIESRAHASVNKVIYRDKSRGWGSGGYAVVTANGIKSIFHSSLDYYHYYLEAPLLRTSCYSCKFAQIDRMADITVGDFWGINEGELSLNSELGISLVLVNSSKGAELASKCSSQLTMTERPLEEALSGNSQLRGPSVKANDYHKLKEQLVRSKGSGRFAAHIAKKYFFRRIRRKLSSVLLKVRRLVK